MNKSDFNLQHQNQHIESKIVASLERISEAFRVLLWRESKEFSLSPIQIQVLIFLLYHSDEKCKVSYLADEFNLTKATISSVVKTLEQKELISKQDQEKDSRSYLIFLTEKGREIATRTSLFTHEIHTPINKLSQEEKENLFLSLLSLIRHLNKKGIITIERMCMTCSFYRPPEGGQLPFCKLLNEELQVQDYRVDCPEHEIA